MKKITMEKFAEECGGTYGFCRPLTEEESAIEALKPFNKVVYVSGPHIAFFRGKSEGVMTWRGREN